MEVIVTGTDSPIVTVCGEVKLRGVERFAAMAPLETVALGRRTINVDAATARAAIPAYAMRGT